MNRLKYVFILTIISLGGCKLIDKPEAIPSFISVDHFDIKINNSFEGTDKHNITDVWVYVDDNLQGVYELPAKKIPLHFQGEKNVRLFAGIKKNGVSNERTIYPFFESSDENLTLIPDSIIPVQPKVKYKENLFIWIEDFEDPSIKFYPHTTSDTTIVIASTNNYSDLVEGDAGLIALTKNQLYAEIRTDELDFNAIPRHLDKPAYLEMHYNSNTAFKFGVLTKDNSLNAYVQTTIITFNPTVNSSNEMAWKKTYIYLPDGTNFYPLSTDIDLFFSCLNNEDRDDIQIFVDNLKVIYYK